MGLCRVPEPTGHTRRRLRPNIPLLWLLLCSPDGRTCSDMSLQKSVRPKWREEATLHGCWVNDIRHATVHSQISDHLLGNCLLAHSSRQDLPERPAYFVTDLGQSGREGVLKRKRLECSFLLHTGLTFEASMTNSLICFS
jgi:hypothetical protein